MQAHGAVPVTGDCYWRVVGVNQGANITAVGGIAPVEDCPF